MAEQAHELLVGSMPIISWCCWMLLRHVTEALTQQVGPGDERRHVSVLTKRNLQHRLSWVQHNATYIDQEIAFVNSQLSSSTATWNFVVGHYPLFGSHVEYGNNDSSAFPGEFSGWAMVRTLGKSVA